MAAIIIPVQTRFLTPELYYIKWLSNPNLAQAATFMDTLEEVFEDLDRDILVISDLRYGVIRDIEVLQRLGRMIQTNRITATTAFSTNPTTAIYVRAFDTFSRRAKEDTEIYDLPEEALAYLETQRPGITQDIKWETILAAKDINTLAESEFRYSMGAERAES